MEMLPTDADEIQEIGSVTSFINCESPIKLESKRTPDLFFSVLLSIRTKKN